MKKMKKSYLLLAVLTLITCGVIAQPTTPASTPPAREASNVISVLGNTYTSLTGTDFNPQWGQTGFSTANTSMTIGGVPTLYYPNFNYQGNQFANPINASSMTSVHVDVWSADCSKLDFYLIDAPTDHESHYTIELTPSTWNSVDIPLTAFATATLNDIIQFKLVSNTPASSAIYIENVYFWKSSNVPTITGFSIPAKNVGDASFTITDPTSNSNGAFTYTSSDSTVATISGNTVTIVGGGTAIITANQAASGSYVSGTTSATLVVKFGTPSTAAPTPSKNAIDVISIYSDAYTNVAGTDFFPNWGQTTVVTDDTIATNATKKYSNMNYQGIQLGGDLNVSAMSTLHIDVWTPNCTAFDVYLINTTGTTTEQNVTLTPTLNGWNSFDIDLTKYTKIDLTKIGQFKLVATPSSKSFVYLDNIYFYKASSTGTAPTITGFAVPAKKVGDPSFTLTDPTSNSAGAFSYTSSNASVATIIGNTVTIVGAGSSLITATQAADGKYTSGTDTSTLVVIGNIIANAPTTPAATPPTREASNVISVLGNTYTSLTGTDFNPQWGQTGFNTANTSMTIGGVPTLYYPNFNYQGNQFANPINASSMTSVHVDVWSADCSKLDFYLIDAPTDHESHYTIELTPSTWNSVDIPLTAFATATLNDIIQFKLVSNTPASSAIYIENVYFWKSSNVPTITGFSIPAKNVGDASFTITDPTSNSNGAFTYTSSDSTVATISGNTVTIVGGGTAIITATQAASGSYISGTTSATLVVNFSSPTTAATTPSKSASNVISLWGNTYTNIDGINWYPNWGQATQLSLLNIAGDTTLKYSSLNYEGVQASAPGDVSKTDFLHLDIWSPNAKAIVINLINSALVTNGAAVQVAYTINLTTGSWNSIDIPLTAFKGVDLTKVDQVMFVGSTPTTGGIFYLQNIYFWSNGPLAVSLANFNASKVGNTATLTWKTLSEVNNKGFNIQRSTNGTNWNTLKYVVGVGTSSNYSFVDNNTSNGVNYYRLALVDANGKISYSSTLSVDFSKSSVGISFYPNPVKSVMNVSIPAIQSNTASLSLVGLNGRTIKTVQLGTQSSNSNVSLNVVGISKGVYMLTLRDGATVKTTKVVVE